MLKLNQNKVLELIFLFNFGLLYILFDWQYYLGVVFADLPVYAWRADELQMGHEANRNFSLLEWISSEPIWTTILESIALNFNNVYNGFLIISLFCVFSFSYYLKKHINLIFVCLFLLHPFVIDLLMSQIRSALALCLLLIAFNSKRILAQVIFFTVAALIHTAMFLVIAVFFTSLIISHYSNKFTKIYINIFCLLLSFTIALTLTVGREALLTTIGDRRIDYNVDVNSLSFLFFWVIFSFALIFTQKKIKGKIPWIDYFSIIFLTAPFFMALFETNGVRFIALAFPTLICSAFQRKGLARLVLVSSIILYQFVLYFFWMKL